LRTRAAWSDVESSSHAAARVPRRVRNRTTTVKGRARPDDAIRVNAFVPPAPTLPLDLPEGFRLAQEPLPTAEPGLLVAATGELDIATAPQLRSTIADALDAGLTRLVVDLRDVSFLDSVAVAVLFHVRRQLGEAGRMSIVVPPDSYAQLVFGVAGLSHCLDVFATRDAAVAHATA
jgi:anti-sigma B factor antagonist